MDWFPIVLGEKDGKRILMFEQEFNNSTLHIIYERDTKTENFKILRVERVLKEQVVEQIEDEQILK